MEVMFGAQQPERFFTNADGYHSREIKYIQLSQIGTKIVHSKTVMVTVSQEHPGNF